MAVVHLANSTIMHVTMYNNYAKLQCVATMQNCNEYYIHKTMMCTMHNYICTIHSTQNYYTKLAIYVAIGKLRMYAWNHNSTYYNTLHSLFDP